MDDEFSHDRTLHSNEKEQATTSCNNMDNCTSPMSVKKKKKLNPKEFTVYDSIHITFLERPTLLYCLIIRKVQEPEKETQGCA